MCVLNFNNFQHYFSYGMKVLQTGCYTCLFHAQTKMVEKCKNCWKKLGNGFKNKSLWFSQKKRIKVGNTAIYEYFLFKAVKNALPSSWYLIFILGVGKLRNSCEGPLWDAFTKCLRITAAWNSYRSVLQRCRALQLKASEAGEALHLCTENYFVTSSVMTKTLSFRE